MVPSITIASLWKGVQLQHHIAPPPQPPPDIRLFPSALNCRCPAALQLDLHCLFSNENAKPIAENPASAVVSSRFPAAAFPRRKTRPRMCRKNRTVRRTQLASSANEIMRSEKIKKDEYPCISCCLFSGKPGNWLDRWEAEGPPFQTEPWHLTRKHSVYTYSYFRYAERTRITYQYSCGIQWSSSKMLENTHQICNKWQYGMISFSRIRRIKVAIFFNIKFRFYRKVTTLLN